MNNEKVNTKKRKLNKSNNKKKKVYITYFCTSGSDSDSDSCYSSDYDIQSEECEESEFEGSECEESEEYEDSEACEESEESEESDNLKITGKHINLNKNLKDKVKSIINNKNISENIRNILYEKYKQFSMMKSHASEYFKLKQWIDDFVKIPFGNYKKFPSTGNLYDDSQFLRNAETILNKKLYGQERAKDELIEIMAKWIINPNSCGQVIGLQGSPGVGKTELAKNCIAPVMDRPFQYISLGGLTDGSYFDGHSYTYEGATFGRLIQMLMDAKCMNPIIFMDELDKVSESKVGQEIIGKLIHLTDPTQNDSIMDKYFTGIPFDFSKALIIFSFNDPNLIDRVLLNRIRIIKMDDFTVNDKVMIANNYLLPKLYEENKINVKFSDKVLKYIIQRNNEPGVRKLKSELENIIMKLNVLKFLPDKQPSITINPGNHIHEFNFDMYHKLYKAYPNDIIDISKLMMYI